MKRDGSGKRYHTGDDLKNVFDTEGDHTLYGVWKTATDTPFRIRVCKTNVAGRQRNRRSASSAGRD